MKFFGSSAEGNEGDSHGDDSDNMQASSARDSLERTPDETTGLLSGRNHGAGDVSNAPVYGSAPYLSPDDPAVTPYNLFSVRATRYFTVFLLLATIIWWVLLLISFFVTPPGLQTRGSPFFAFSYASMALASLIVSLLFFAAPSRSSRIIAAITAALLLTNAIIIAAVERTRHEEAWVGITSVVWAFLMMIWTIAADRIVQWGKHEEEARLTGRAETRRTLIEWIEVIVSTTVLLALCIVSVLMTFSLILRALDAGLVPLGKRYWVDDNKYEVHLYCHGSKSKKHLPTVLIEGGDEPVEHGLWQFAEAAVANGSINRYCFADRPGYAWSDTAPSPFSAGEATAALSEALARAGEVGPWVLVGAGIGSIYSRVFSSRHGAEIEGLLLIDPLHEDLLDRVGAPRRGFLLWLRGILSPLGLDRTPGAIFRGRDTKDRVWGRAAYQSGKTTFAKLQESLVASSLTRRDAITSRAIQYKDTPLAVVSSAVQIRTDAAWESKQRDLTHLTSKLLGWDIVQAPHAVWKTLAGRAAIEKHLEKMVHLPKVAEGEEAA